MPELDAEATSSAMFGYNAGTIYDIMYEHDAKTLYYFRLGYDTRNMYGSVFEDIARAVHRALIEHPARATCDVISGLNSRMGHCLVLGDIVYLKCSD